MALPIVGIIGSVLKNGFGIFGDYLEGKRKLKYAEVNAKLRMLESAQAHTQDWENLWAQQASSSLKDEWWTAIVSIPLILVFFPGMVGYVREGFEVLNTLPEWYIQLVMIAFGASFGIRIIPKGFNILKSLAKKPQ